MARKRDYQRGKVYKAEGYLGPGKKFESLQLVQAFCDKIINSKAWKIRWPHKTKVFLKDGRGTSRAWGMNGSKGAIQLNLPKWARKERTIIHELAHGVTPVSEPWHGHVFCGIYLEMIGLFMGKEQAEKLRLGFVKYGVDYGYDVPTHKDMPVVEIKRKLPKGEGRLTIQGETLKGAITVSCFNTLNYRYATLNLTVDNALTIGQALIDYAKKHGKNLK
jgi:putative metallohydrolase (TIGR04338 family)